MPTVADALAERLLAAEVDTAFGLLGEANLALALALQKAGGSWLAFRREDAVVAAADGFAQGSGRLGVAFVSQGPALANALNPLIGARKNGTPLVLVTGALPEEAVDAPQWCDHRSIAAAAGVPLVRLDRPADAADLFAAALARVRQEGPVVLEVPTRLQTSVIPARTDSAPAPALAPLPEQTCSGHAEALERSLAHAVARLCDARRPVILAGHGALGSADLLVEIAERTGAALVTTLKTKGLFTGHARDLGVAGGFGPPATQRTLDEADLALVVGATLNDFTTRGGRLFRSTPLIRMDRVHAVRDAGPGDIPLTGDAHPLLEQLVARLRAIDLVVRSGWPPARTADLGPDCSSEHGLDLRTVARFLDEALPEDRALCTDLGYFTSEPAIHVRVRSPRRHAFPLHFGSIGLGLAAALGLSAADRSVPTLCVVGDGGLCAALGELETLARTGLPVVVAVFNDSAYGVEVQELRHQGEDVGLAQFPPVDFAAVAESLGITGLRARRPEDLPAIAARLRAPDGPLLVDFTIDPYIVTAWYREFVHPAATEELP